MPKRSRPVALVVEDEPLIRAMVAAVAEDRGYEVLEADSDREARRRLEERGAPQVLITDIGLAGGGDGWGLAQEARQRAPDVTVLYVTGGRAHEFAHRAVRDSEILQKPFAPDRLASLLPPAGEGARR